MMDRSTLELKLLQQCLWQLQDLDGVDGDSTRVTPSLLAVLMQAALRHRAVFAELVETVVVVLDALLIALHDGDFDSDRWSLLLTAFLRQCDGADQLQQPNDRVVFVLVKVARVLHATDLHVTVAAPAVATDTVADTVTDTVAGVIALLFHGVCPARDRLDISVVLHELTRDDAAIARVVETVTRNDELLVLVRALPSWP
ncbi:MAG: hypothetical protein MHM6MM_005030, partial [Cercozoa sp. M6MM]